MVDLVASRIATSFEMTPGHPRLSSRNIESLISHCITFCLPFDSSKDYLNRVAEGSGNVDPQGNFSIEGENITVKAC